MTGTGNYGNTQCITLCFWKMSMKKEQITYIILLRYPSKSNYNQLCKPDIGFEMIITELHTVRNLVMLLENIPEKNKLHILD